MRPTASLTRTVGKANRPRGVGQIAALQQCHLAVKLAHDGVVQFPLIHHPAEDGHGLGGCGRDGRAAPR